MDTIEQWRPIPNFPGHEVSTLGRVRRLVEVAPGRDGTVPLVAADGSRNYRSVLKLREAVWRDLIPETLRRPSTASVKPPASLAPTNQPTTPPAKPPEAKPLSSTFQRLMAQQAAKAAALERPQDLTAEEIQALLARLG